MPKILLHTTEPRTHRRPSFRTLAAVLREGGNEVWLHDAGQGGILRRLDDTVFDQVWLFAADEATGLTPEEVRALLHFRESGGAMLTSRGADDIGASLLNLGAFGAVNHFRSYNRAASPPSGQSCADPALPFSRIRTPHPLHPALRAGAGTLAYVPARARGGSISLPALMHGCVVAADDFGGALVIAVEAERTQTRESLGRAIATASNHLFEDHDLQAAMEQPQLFEAYTAWVNNLAHWLGSRTAPLGLRELLGRGLRVCEPKIE